MAPMEGQATNQVETRMYEIRREHDDEEKKKMTFLTHLAVMEYFVSK